MRTLNERFATAADRLGSDRPAAVRLAGVYAMAGLADDWAENRQTCVDVLCAYLRMPYAPDPGENAAESDRLAFQADREVRHTAVRVIAAHLRPDAEASWQGVNLDFTGVVFDGGDFSRAVFSGGQVDFSGAKFSGGQVGFVGAEFSGGQVGFSYAEFSGGQVGFSYAEFSGGQVDFSGAKFSGGQVGFGLAKFSGGQVGFGGAKFSGGQVDFSFAEFSGSQVDFGGAEFSGGQVGFGGAKFSGGQVGFGLAEFSGGQVGFGLAEFSGGQVGFGLAEFSGGQVDFRAARRWSPPPRFVFGSSPPPAVLLPEISQADGADSSVGSAPGEAAETGRICGG